VNLFTFKRFTLIIFIGITIILSYRHYNHSLNSYIHTHTHTQDWRDRENYSYTLDEIHENTKTHIDKLVNDFLIDKFILYEVLNLQNIYNNNNIQNKMSFIPQFHSIRQDLLQLFSDIERDLGLVSWPNTELGGRQMLLEQSNPQLTSGNQQQQQQQQTAIAPQESNTQLSTVDFSKPLAANFKINEENDKFVATAEFPGVNPQDLQISVRNGMITLDARRGVARENTSESPDKTSKSYSYSSSSERVARTIPLPPGIDENKVETSFHDGKLELILGKSARAMQSTEQLRAAEKQQQTTGQTQQPSATRQSPRT
jgi:HSP20 family molecular chaperone IbpA